MSREHRFTQASPCRAAFGRATVKTQKITISLTWNKAQAQASIHNIPQKNHLDHYDRAVLRTSNSSSSCLSENIPIPFEFLRNPNVREIPKGKSTRVCYLLAQSFAYIQFQTAFPFEFLQFLRDHLSNLQDRILYSALLTAITSSHGKAPSRNYSGTVVLIILGFKQLLTYLHPLKSSRNHSWCRILSFIHASPF